MSIIKFNSKEKELLARLMRAEAIGEGELGMLMVGNVIVNRGIANCLTFNDVRTISDVIYQSPGGFAGINSPLFFSSPTSTELRLADDVLRGRYYYPATHALWFYAPQGNEACQPFWWGQQLAGRFKNHCFYRPEIGICTAIR